MRLFPIFALLALIAHPVRAQNLLGSGSTFIYPVMTRWIDAYQKASGAQITYQPIGSTAGITEMRLGVVDFAISEVPEDSADLLRDDLDQYPLVIGAIVPAVNVSGIAAGQLRLTGPLLADIFLGKIARWNDPAIAELNPGLKLPALAITVIHRSDGSGTTFVWADYLSRVSPEWKAKVGASTSLAWPTGYGAKGNGGVADKITLARGAIGYVDYSDAIRRHLATAIIRNQAGNFVAPEPKSFHAAIMGFDWSADQNFHISLTDAPAPDAYPIMGASFALIRDGSRSSARPRHILPVGDPERTGSGNRPQLLTTPGAADHADHRHLGSPALNAITAGSLPWPRSGPRSPPTDPSHRTARSPAARSATSR